MVSTSIKGLGLPLDQFVVVGSGIMDQLGIRNSADIDLCVSDQLYEELKSLGWKTITFIDGEEGLQYSDGVTNYEAMKRFSDGITVPNFNDLIKDSIQINGVHFLSPEYLLIWKQNKNRAKDRRDVGLLRKYLESSKKQKVQSIK